MGWTIGSDLRIEARWGTDPASFARYAAELIALDADVLVGEATPSAAAFQRQTRTIPIVFSGIADPVGQGFVASLARPGGNITGLSIFDAPMAGKWLEMLRQVSPPVARVAVLFNPATTPWAGMMLQALQQAAPSFDVAVRAAPVASEAELEALMAEIAREEHGGVLVLANVFAMTYREAIINLAAKHRLPAVYGFRVFVADGGLMSYGIDPAEVFPNTADYVDRILKGAKAGDLPVQQPTKFELVINLKTAKTLGITIAPILLATADEVIE